MALEQNVCKTRRFADIVKPSARHGAEKGGIVALEHKAAMGNHTSSNHLTLTMSAEGENVTWTQLVHTSMEGGILAIII